MGTAFNGMLAHGPTTIASTDAVDASIAAPARSLAVAPAHFEAVYEAYAEFVWRNARRLGVPPSAVDDVVQDVFVVIHRKLGTLRSAESLRAWIFSILVRVVRTHQRTRRRREPEAQAASPVSPDVIAESPHAGPLEQAVQSDAVRLLRDLLDELEIDRRTVFLLSELEEMSVPEISQALGLNLNTVYSRLRAARKQFEEAVARRRQRDEWRLR